MSRLVLSEHRAKWRQPTIYVGDTVYLTLPATEPASPVTCAVGTPDGTLEADVLVRQTSLFGDYCAVVPATREGRHRFTFTLPDGRKARGSYIVHRDGRKRN